MEFFTSYLHLTTPWIWISSTAPTELKWTSYMSAVINLINQLFLSKHSYQIDVKSFTHKNKQYHHPLIVFKKIYKSCYYPRRNWTGSFLPWPLDCWLRWPFHKYRYSSWVRLWCGASQVQCRHSSERNCRRVGCGIWPCPDAWHQSERQYSQHTL